MTSKLCACLLNVSEARNVHIIEKIAYAALEVNNKTSKQHCAAVLNVFSDYDYNRTVITIAASISHIGQSVFAACEKAFDLIDLRQHEGVHPCLGSVDLVPIHPLSPDITLEECGKEAKDLAEKLSSKIPGTSFFLFGWSHQACRGLVQRRKDVRWFAGHKTLVGNSGIQDVGAKPGARYGLTGIGAHPYVMNCNVTIDTQDLTLGKQIAQSLRAVNPDGLPGVQSMAFLHEGRVEIACNVASFSHECDQIKEICSHRSDEKNFSEVKDNCKTLGGHQLLPDQELCMFGQYKYVSPEVIEKKVKARAAIFGVETVGRALIGFTPAGAADVAKFALDNGIYDYWKTKSTRTM
ncbi:uncharacterized protein LOC106172384 [Lingula anatina]|uniref:Uncharacterized protein LOC106172384 n=1 Tax=Lingula anatina TaxID=7574 RepID=A0A1S3JDM6_LINAN|nr:uncharacterized protein LOC106172384 [Lingula anatina]|eukprot:XP_013408515.1 uncharacterized protein LOC106172384 [Lingula anatina]